jgi:hypothetical protein
MGDFPPPPPSILSGTLGARPLAGVAGRFYWATDVQMMFEDTGVLWVTAAIPWVLDNNWADDFTRNFGVSGIDGVGGGRIDAVPINIPFTMTVDRILIVLQGAAGNGILGIYRDNGFTPVGGALVVQSASTALADGSNYLVIASTRLTPSLYWIALTNDVGIGNIFHVNNWRMGQGGRLFWCDVNMGVYNPLPDPCPVLNLNASSNFFSAWLRIASIP